LRDGNIVYMAPQFLRLEEPADQQALYNPDDDKAVTVKKVV